MLVLFTKLLSPAPVAFGKGDWFTSSSIGVNIAVPIFSGFAKDARIKKAKIEIEYIEDDFEKLLDKKSREKLDKEINQKNINSENIEELTANVEELNAYNRLFETVFLSFRAEGLNINEINTEFNISK